MLRLLAERAMRKKLSIDCGGGLPIHIVGEEPSAPGRRRNDEGGGGRLQLRRANTNKAHETGWSKKREPVQRSWEPRIVSFPVVSRAGVTWPGRPAAG